MAAAAAAVGAPRAAGRRGRWRRGRPDRRPRLGRARAHAGRARVRLEQLRGAGLHHRHAGHARSTPFRATRARIASCATWSAPTSTTSFRRCAATSTATASPRSRCAAAVADSSTPAGSIPTIHGSSWAARSIERTTGHAPTILPNLGGSLPNDIFVDVLGLQDDLGAALLCRLLAARARRAPAGADRARRAWPDGRTVLGSRRARYSAMVINGSRQ